MELLLAGAFGGVCLLDETRAVLCDLRTHALKVVDLVSRQVRPEGGPGGRSVRRSRAAGTTLQER